MSNLHEIEERDFGRGPALWDADPEVCCAAFQLGACVHTEGFEEFGWCSIHDMDLGPAGCYECLQDVELAESFEGFDDYDADDDAAFWGGVVVSDAEMAALVGGEEEPF